jgi:hypothetical protein
MKLRLILIGLLLSTAVNAREGFSVNIGIGGGFWSLDNDSLHESLAEIGRSDGQRLIETLDDGLALRFSMAYNIRGYASIEIGMTAHGWNLGGDIGGSGHAAGVVHIHPLQFFLPERDYDFSIYLGGGYSIIGGGHKNDDNDRGLDGGTLETGFAGTFYLTPWFSLGADFRFSVPFYDRWFVDWNDDEDYPLDTTPDMFFFSLTIVSTFRFQAPG